MKRIVWSISLLILLLNTLWTPLTYAEEYAQESVNPGVIDDIQNDDVVENDEGDERSPQFPVNENFDDEQKPEIDPVDPVTPVDENPTDPVVPVVDEWSWGMVEEPVNPDDDTLWSWWNQWGENSDTSEALSWGNQEVDFQTWGSGTSETDFSGGNNEDSWTGWSSTEDSEDEGWESWIISTVTSALQDFLSTIRFFFVSDDNDYIKESKINWVKTITLEDLENWEKLTIMDRNLWAEDNDIQSEDSYGYYYQWWNNNGFEEVNDSNVTSMLAVYSWKYEWIGYTRDNKFRVGSSDIWEADEEWKSNYDELWYLWENVEVQWPCPEGYHIPSLNEWNKLVSIWTKIHTQDEKDEVKVTRSTSSDTIESSLERCWTWDFENQENCIVKEELPGLANLFMNELKLPRAWSYVNWEKENSLWVYWTRTPWDLSYQSEVFSIEKFFWVEVNENDYKNRSNANSLRCFRNIKNSPSLFGSLSLGDDTLSLNDVDWYTITFDSNWWSPVDPAIWVQPTEDLETYRPKTDPYRVGYMFLWWFDDLNNATRYKFQWTNISTDLVLYAKWAPFNDIVYTWTVNGVTYSITLMDRNMWATATWAMNNATVDSYGFYYMWWNNYWFYYDKGTSINDKYTDASLRPNVSLNGPGNWAYEERFYYGSNAQDNWASSNNNNLWWWDWDNDSNDYDNGNKSYTRQWPCPKWYHVPSIWERYKLLRLFMNNEYPNHSVTTVLNNGTWKNKVWKWKGNDLTITDDIRNKIGDTFYLPYAWRVQKTYAWNRQVWDTGDWPRAPYWSSTTKESNKGLWTELKHKDKMFSLWAWSDERVQGKAVRCFKNQDAYTIKWKNLEDSSLSASGYILETDYFVDWDEHPHYDWLTPVRGETPFIWWYIEGGNKRQVYTQEDLDDFTITGDVTFVAKFKTYDIDVEIIPSMWWVVSWVDDYYEWSGISLTAEANEWYQFTWWYDESDNLVSTDNPYEFTADASDWTWLKALFELKQYIVTVVSNDSSKGTINVTQRPYTHGKRIEFSPNYNSWEYKFVKWKLNWEDVKTWGNQYRTWNLVIEYLTSDLTVTGYFSVYNSCNLPWWGTIAHWDSTWAYSTPTVPYGQSCVQEIRVCNDWNLSWSYEYKNCEIETPTSCDLPWWGTLANWESVTGYASASETCPDQCIWQRATCNNGEWNIPDFVTTYTKSNCTTNWVDTDWFPLNSCPEHWYCNYKTWYSVSNNACVKWDVKYNLTSCELWYHTEDWLTCTGNTKFVQCLHNDQIPDHATETVEYVPVNWNWVSWDEPKKCRWECDIHYHKNWNQCDIDTFDITWKYSTETGEQTVVESYVYGFTPSRVGNNYQTEQTWYTFNGWDPAPYAVTWDETYTAIYDEILRDYQIIWKFKNTYGIEETENTTWYYGTLPSHVDGVNYQTAQTWYIFVWWSPAIHSITWAETYTAIYDEVLRDYTITWKYKNSEGVEQIETVTWYYGTMPSHASWANYQTTQTWYTFAWWTPEVHSIIWEETYRAVYDEELRSYTITFHSNWWSSVDAQTKAYWTVWDKPENPTRDGYDFNGWYSNSGLTIEYHFTEVIEWNVDLYAKRSPITYTITYEYNNGTGSNPETYQIITPEFTLSNPTRIGYTFIWWSGTSLVGSWNKTVTISVWSTWNRAYEANWKANKYQVTYKANGWEGEDVKDEVTYDEHYEFLSNSFVRTGYSFVEWNTKADGSWSGFVEWFSGIWKTTTWVNLYAIWNENSYNVAYLGWEWAIWSKVWFTTGYTNTFVLADNEWSFIKTWYTFSWWTYDGKHYAAGTELSRLAAENWVTVTFTAEWNKETYTISYEYNNGTGSNPGTYQVDTPSFALNNPTRTGYTFIWWSGTELEGLDNTNVTIVIWSVGDREYEANWQANKYNVTYKANGWEWVDVVEEAVYDAKYVFTGNKFTKTGYRFVEWNTKSDGTGTWYTEWFSGIWKTTTWVNLYAQWTAETYTVTFDGNEWEVVWDNTKEVSYDGEYGELPTATRLWYTFTGWYTEDTAGDKVEGETRVATANDHILYAHWDENSYNVVYEGWIWSEGVVTWATYRYTESFNLAANNFTKRGYSFSGWKNGDNHYAAGAELSRLATQNWATVTITAEWNVVPYSITYKLNGWIFSWVVNPTTYDVNSSTINVGNPEKVWYIFLWWTGTDLSALTTKVVITGWSIWDRTYYANWQARDDIKITINHYLQDLDVDNNTVLDTYSISWTVKEEWTADSTINVSDYKQTIEWYSFDSWKVDGSVVSTTTVSPDWSRVIDLFYTRNSYSYAITTSVWSSTEWSSSNGNYYYWAKVILSWDSNNDCFVWSGWAVQWATLENMKQTSFIMPANDVTANSLVREKTYNIVFNGNWEDSWTMSPLNWIRCTQEFTLPENSFVKTGYTFTWWTTIPNGVKEFDNKATIQTLTTWDNVTIEFIAIWDVNYYPIVWKDYDWDVLYEDEFPYMENPEYHWETPSRDADEQYTYTFAWWTPGVHIVTWAQVYTAVYNETLNEYTVTWDVDWTRMMETYKYWETPNFTWSKHKDPDEQYEYSFAWWTPEISSVTGDITYTATYTATLRKFTVTWNNRNGQTLEVDTWVEYWSDPSYNWETPTKPADAGHTYTFNWWIPELTWVTKDTIYVAKFSSDDNKYTITWLDEDDTILEIDTDVPYWTTPSYDKWTPVKTWDAQYSYTFSWWSPAVIPVEGDATYVATYTPHVNTYTITWKNSNWETLREDAWVAYWVTGDFGWIPTSWSTDEFDYEFIWWNPAVWAIHGDTTYTAVYKSNKRKYSVRFVNGETELQSWMVEYGEMPVYTWLTPEKTWDAQYSYSYIWWTPGISAVTWDITYEAIFEEIVNMYNVTFVDDDGSSVIQPAQKYTYWTLRGNIAKPVNPDKPDNEQYTYEFAWWIPVVSKITWDVTFTATYSWTLRTYSVTWKNWNGDVLETDANVPYWETPSYDSVEPTKPATAQYRYEFKWWDPVVSPVHGTIIYTAQFDEVPMTYTITWKNWDTVLEVDTWVVYWSIPSYDWVIPTKASDPQYDYVFAWWNPSTWEVVSDQVYVADFDPIIRTYTVLWKNHDGTTLETDENVPYWSTPSYNWSTPVKTWNAQYSYTFKDWSPDIWPIHGNTEYTAIYNETINKYVVAWDNYDWTELSSEEVEYWTLPTYTGSTPTRPKTAQYTYIFSNSWLPAVTAVTTGATYTAQFTSIVNEYTITWKDWDWNTLKTEQVAYGGTPEYTWATPTKTADAQYTYSFNDTWSPAIESVTGDMTYTAQFDSTVNIYPITWKDWDDQVLKTDYVAYGDTPEYTWAIPTKTATQEHTYTFKWWSPAVQSVTGPATYKAVFDGDVNEYAITWLDWDWNILKMETLEYGQMPSYSWATPTKTATAQYSYTFNNTWSPAIVSVTTGATYTAQFSSTVNEYTITWKDWDWNTIKTDQVAYGQTPTYVGNTPTKTATAQYSYTFAWWDPEIKTVTTGATYTAQFDSTVNKYAIVWKDWDWTILKPAEDLEYGVHPEYWLETPTREWDAHYSYTFIWWNPAVQNVTGPQTYTATYLQTVNKYLITFLNDDDSVIVSKQVEYWTTVENYQPADPEKEWYTFNWWNPNLVTVVTWVTYKATYTINQYTLTPELWVWLERIEWWWTFDYGTEVIFTWYAKEGYHFEGGETVKVFTVTVWAHNATVRINAIANKYVVRFQPNEWDWTMQDQEFTYDLTWILHANSFRRSWYTFTWWIDEFGNYYADQWKVYNLATWWVVEFTALWKVWEDKPVEPTPAAWWGRIIPKEDKDQEHGSADTQTWWTWAIDSGSQYTTWDVIPWDGSWTQEEMDAYKYAYKYHITTLAPREAAMPDDYVIRWHMAKMVVNYAVNVLWWKLPEKLPKQCKWNDWVDAWESQEIKDYAEKACALWLMWIDMNYFQPNKYVTRAQFWTIFGRLLRWKLPSTPYYAAHLAWLKERWIMTQIENPEDRIEIRKWAWLMFMRSEKYFIIKK